jgi:phage-related protein
MTLYPTTNPFAFERTIIVDASSDYQTAPSKAQLNSYAQSYARRNAVNPTVSVKVNFVPVWQTEEYKEYIDFEQVNLCDYVTIVYPPLNLELKAQVVKTVYNVLLDRYDSLEISTIKKSLANTIFAMQKQIIRNSISNTNARRLIR